MPDWFERTMSKRWKYAIAVGAAFTVLAAVAAIIALTRPGPTVGEEYRRVDIGEGLFIGRDRSGSRWFDFRSQVIAIDIDGTVRWQTDVPYTRNPAVPFDDLLIVGYEGVRQPDGFVAIGLDGTPRWQVEVPGYADRWGLDADQLVVAAKLRGDEDFARLLHIDASSGELVGAVTLLEDEAFAQIRGVATIYRGYRSNLEIAALRRATIGDIVVVGSERRPSSGTAASEDAGRVQATRGQEVLWTHITRDYPQSVIVYRGVVFVVTGDPLIAAG